MRGDGRIFRRGTRWWISYYGPDQNDPGRMKEYRESAGEAEADAKRLLRDRRREVVVHRSGLRQFQGPRQERVLVEELLKGLEREHEILGLIAEGLSNGEIGERLFVSENTVKTHSSRLFDKLGVNRRVQAVQKGRELGLVP